MVTLRRSSSDHKSLTAGRFWRRLGANLVVVELTLAMALLTGAGLLGKSLYRLLHVDLGFDPSHLATVELMMTDPASQKPEALKALYREIDARGCEPAPCPTLVWSRVPLCLQTADS